MARPRKLTPQLQEQICRAIRTGNYMETAAAYAGINKSTLYDWMKRGAREKERVRREAEKQDKDEGDLMDDGEVAFVQFSNAIQKALADAEMLDLQVINRAAKGGAWQAAAWKLERRNPQKWGRKGAAEVEHSGEVKNTQEHKYHIIQEIINDPDTSERIKENFRHRVGEGSGRE